MRPHSRKMTLRAQLYLGIAATRHLVVCGIVFWLPESLTEAPSFQPIVLAAPAWLWGILFLGAGIACAFGALTRRSALARLGLMWSASSTGMVTVGLIVGAFTGDLVSFIWPTVFAAMAAKDFTVCADPLRSPFEDWVDEIADREDSESAGGTV